MRVLIVDDHALFSEALGPLLEQNGMEVLGIAASGAEALEAVQREHPEVVLVDLGLPDMPGLTLGRAILEQQPGTKVLAVTGLDHARVAREVLQAGFHGFLTKDTPLPQFIKSVRAAMEGQVINLPRRERARSGAGDDEQRDAALLAGQLTPRELEVLEILVQGGSNAEIARQLHLSPNTVRTHVQSILTKLQVRSRLEAAAFAVRFGIVRNGERQFA
jgi:NarL family two-component system response regulator LiaR